MIKQFEDVSVKVYTAEADTKLLCIAELSL
jgi:hypothetical protein